MGCAKSAFWSPELYAAYSAEDSKGFKLLMHMRMAQEAHELYGAPRDVFLELSMPIEGAPRILADLQYANKTATRLPEALFFSFGISPPATAQAWQLNKLDQVVASDDVMPGGGVHLHAVGLDVGAALPLGIGAAAGNVTVMTRDSGLVSVGLKSSLPTPLQPLTKAAASGPLYFILQNNFFLENKF